MAGEAGGKYNSSKAQQRGSFSQNVDKDKEVGNNERTPSFDHCNPKRRPNQSMMVTYKMWSCKL
jgi:hypothetical protein